MAIKPKPQAAAPVAQSAPVSQPAAQQTVTVTSAPAPAKRTRKVQPPSQAVPTGSALAEVKGTHALVPASLSNLEAMAHQGLEQANSSDFATPIFKVIKKHDSHEVGEIEGCEAGYMLLTSTKEMWSGEDGPLVIPCFYQRRYIEWRAKNGTGGGGIVAEYPPTHAIVGTTRRNEQGKDILPNGNELSNTMQFFVLVQTEQGWSPALMNLSGGGLKIGRDWLTAQTSQRMNGSRGAFVPPTYAYVYRAGTELRVKGQSKWFEFTIGAGVPLTDEAAFQQADAFYRAASSGGVKVAQEEPASAPAQSDPNPPTAGFDDTTEGEELPF